MEEKSTATLEKIQWAAMEEFTEKGFQGASLRQIVKQAGVTILRTDELGTIVARTDGKEVTFTWDNQSANPENAEPAQPVQFIGNVNSHKFHSPDCANLPTEKNRIIFGTYEEAVNAGYTPCGSCLG